MNQQTALLEQILAALVELNATVGFAAHWVALGALAASCCVGLLVMIGGIMVWHR